MMEIDQQSSLFMQLVHGSRDSNPQTPQNSQNSQNLLLGYHSTPLTNALHEYELTQSDSLPFLFSLLYDEQSILSKADVLEILNCYERREKTLPFSYNKLKQSTSVQGLFLAPSLRRKFYMDRLRVGQYSWFRNVPGSRKAALAVSLTCSLFHSHYSILTSITES